MILSYIDKQAQIFNLRFFLFLNFVKDVNFDKVLRMQPYPQAQDTF